MMRQIDLISYLIGLFPLSSAGVQAIISVVLEPNAYPRLRSREDVATLQASFSISH